MDDHVTEVSSGYVWHFKLAPDTETSPEADRLTGMVRHQVGALLRCVIFTDHGAEVKVTGFRFLGQPDVEHSLLKGDADEA